MRRGLASASLIVAVAAGLGLALRAGDAAALDFAAARKATDAFARQSDPEAKLWRVDARASLAGGAPEVVGYVFHYVYRHSQGMGAMALQPTPAGVTHARGALVFATMEPWQTAPLPGTIRAPETILRELQRGLPSALAQEPTAAGRADPSRPGAFGITLLYAGAELASSERNQFQWTSLGRMLGVPFRDMQFFARTAPSGRWIWWTAVTLDRPDPRTDPRAAGRPARVSQFFYVDALTGKIETHCLGPVSGPVSCEAVDSTPPTAGAAPPGPVARPAPPAPRRGVLMATGRVTSFSGARLVLVTDRDASTSPPKGTELSFVVNQRHLQALKLQQGDLVWVRYEERGSRLLATEIRIRPPE